MSLFATDDFSRGLDIEAVCRALLRSPWIGAAIVAGTVALQLTGHVNGDTSWFMTFADKVLDGAVPYADIGDPNPPAAFAVYLPAVAIAHWLHLRAEAVVVGFTLIAALLSIAATGHILRRSGPLAADDRVPLFNAASFALLLVPALCFAEREHVVLLLVLPFLGVCAGRLRNAELSTATSVAAGLAAGLALGFKPYYALPIGAAALCHPVMIRRWQALIVPEIAAVAAAVAAVIAATFVLCPHYAATLALATDIYGPAHEGLFRVFCVPAFLTNAVLVGTILAAAPRSRADPRVVVTTVASIGFAGTYLLQCKGWMNHAYPGFALALIASTALLLDPRPETPRRWFGLYAFLPACIVAPLCFGLLVDLADAEQYPGLQAAVARLAPPHPRIAVLAEELGVGHPLVRRLDGTWVGRQNCLWESYAASIARDASTDTTRRAALESVIEADVRDFAEDVARGHPDVILVESPKLEAWAQRQTANVHMFDNYRHAGDAAGIAIWLRNRG